jgi:arsenate reductase
MALQEQRKAPKKTKVLFVCIGNSCRSQMAEALARHLASDVLEPASAGLAPLGEVVAPTRSVLAERGVKMDGQYSKGLTQAARAEAEIIVNMTNILGKSVFLGSKARVEDWPVEDPYGEDAEIYRQICDDIERRVADLAERLRRQPSAAGKA